MCLDIQENASLKGLNTFGFDVSSRYLVRAHSVSDVLSAYEFVAEKDLPALVLGGGSNIVFTKDYLGVVILAQLKGKSIVKIDETTLQVSAFAGENWHDFVKWSIEHDAQGLENLSLIPGTVGAAPVQNIGAYGVELKDYFSYLTAIDTTLGKEVKLSLEDCQFAYRDSVFKKHPNRYFITNVVFKLNAMNHAQLKTQYGGLEAELMQSVADMSEATPKMVSNVVCNIRRSKIPDPTCLGNAGSFFKNPVIGLDDVLIIKKQYPDMPTYPHGDEFVKVAAGWLIEQAGFKGHKADGVGVHDKQALILINQGHGTGEQLLKLASQIQDQVKQMFSIELEIEPLVI